MAASQMHRVEKLPLVPLAGPGPPRLASVPNRRETLSKLVRVILLYLHTRMGISLAAPPCLRVFPLSPLSWSRVESDLS